MESPAEPGEQTLPLSHSKNEAWNDAWLRSLQTGALPRPCASCAGAAMRRPLPEGGADLELPCGLSPVRLFVRKVAAPAAAEEP